MNSRLSGYLTVVRSCEILFSFYFWFGQAQGPFFFSSVWFVYVSPEKFYVLSWCVGSHPRVSFIKLLVNSLAFVFTKGKVGLHSSVVSSVVSSVDKLVQEALSVFFAGDV